MEELISATASKFKNPCAQWLASSPLPAVGTALCPGNSLTTSQGYAPAESRLISALCSHAEA